MRSRDGWPSYVRLPASRSKYQHIIAEWLSSRAAEPSGAKSKTTASERIVDELIGAYLDFAKTYYVKNGVLTGEYRNIGDAMRPLTALYGRDRVGEFGPSELKAVRQAMIDANLCRRTINNRINRIRRVFKWGVENEFVQPRFFTRYKPSHRCPPENAVGDGVGKRCCGWRRPVLGLRVAGCADRRQSAVAVHVLLFKGFFSFWGKPCIVFFSDSDKKTMRKAVMVTVGNAPLRLIRFITREEFGDLRAGIGGDDTVAVYLPMSYQVGGFTTIVPRSAVQPIDMSIEQAMRFAVTAGMSEVK